MDGRRRTDANRSAHRTRLTGRSPGIARGRVSVLVGAPDGGCGAGVADRPRLVHGAERERMLEAPKQARDLDDSALRTRCDRHMTHAAAPDPSPTSNRSSSPRLYRFQRHVRSSLDGCEGDAVRRSAYAGLTQYLNDAFVPSRPPPGPVAGDNCSALDSPGARVARGDPVAAAGRGRSAGVRTAKAPSRRGGTRGGTTGPVR